MQSLTCILEGYKCHLVDIQEGGKLYSISLQDNYTEYSNVILAFAILVVT